MAPSVSGRAARTSTASAAAAAARKPSGPPGWRPGAIGRDRPSSPAPEVTALFQESAGQHHLVHLRGAVDEACLAGVAVHPLQRRVLGVTPRAEELDRGVHRLVQGAGEIGRASCRARWCTYV